MSQATDDALAALAHYMQQQDTAARSWQAQAEEWKAVADRQRDGLTAVLAYEIEHNGLLGEQQDRLRAALGMPAVVPLPITQVFAELAAVAGPYFDGVDVDVFMQEVRGGDLEQELAELRASASMAIDRWKRSEAIRVAAVRELAMANEELEGLRADRRALCDLLSADPRTVAGQTLVEALAAILTRLQDPDHA
jgi:hypothetical protein